MRWCPTPATLDTFLDAVLHDVNVVEPTPILWTGAEPLHSSSGTLTLPSQMQAYPNKIERLFWFGRAAS